MESKLILFNRIMSTIDEMKSEDVESFSETIQKRVLTMEEYRTALRVGLYSAFKNEVRTDLLFSEGDVRRKEMYYPAVDEGAGSLSYFRITKLEQLIASNIGIKEPTIKQSRLRDLSTLNAIIVPGVAFDLHGGRLGYGKGFYDKCLSTFSGKRIALAYDFQIVSELPTAVRGRKLDWIVTEKRIIRC